MAEATLVTRTPLRIGRTAQRQQIYMARFWQPQNKRGVTQRPANISEQSEVLTAL